MNNKPCKICYEHDWSIWAMKCSYLEKVLQLSFFHQKLEALFMLNQLSIQMWWDEDVSHVMFCTGDTPTVPTIFIRLMQSHWIMNISFHQTHIPAGWTVQLQLNIEKHITRRMNKLLTIIKLSSFPNLHFIYIYIYIYGFSYELASYWLKY